MLMLIWHCQGSVNIMLVSFAWSDLNDVMTVILSVPAQTISVMAATRLYVLLYQETGNRHRPFKDTSSLPSFTSPGEESQSGSASFPMYVWKDSSKVGIRLYTGDVPLKSKRPFQDDSSVLKAAHSSELDSAIPLTVKTSQSRMRMPYDEQDPFARRPSTSPASMQQPKRGPSVFIHETCTVVSEPLPAHFRGPHLEQSPHLEKRKHRPTTGGPLGQAVTT